MRYSIYKNSHGGIGLVGIELFITLILLYMISGMLKITIHPAIRLILSIITVIIIFEIFVSSKIGCMIISIFYTGIWTLIAYAITYNITGGDKIWIAVIGVLVFLISYGLHLSCWYDSGDDYTITSMD
ncbi:hypothetical protein [Clostridium beijerinckii]|uniref:hypothetical protein n=1 Tax=Clostridium beijerinckii TaxID=1520 RepID=UPI00047A44A9|nr:hypothetical protein [Clostridium beijerinckii]